KPRPRRTKMTPAELVEQVKSKKWGVQNQAHSAGPEAVTMLRPLLKDPDTQIRELAIYCIGAAGGPAAGEALLQALNDPIETVSAAAVRELAKHYSAAEIPAMRKQMIAHTSEYVRQRLALILGK